MNTKPKSSEVEPCDQTKNALRKAWGSFLKKSKIGTMLAELGKKKGMVPGRTAILNWVSGSPPTRWNIAKATAFCEVLIEHKCLTAMPPEFRTPAEATPTTDGAVGQVTLRRPALDPQITFEIFSEVALHADTLLLEYLAKSRHLTNEALLREAHLGMLNGHLGSGEEHERRSFPGGLKEWVAALNDHDTRDKLSKTLPDPAMSIIVEDDGIKLTKITYVLKDERSLEVGNPQLVWDCVRFIHGPNSSQERTCPIHGTDVNRSVADEIDRAFEREIVEYVWRGLRVLWRYGKSNGKELWGPSVDAFHFLMDIDAEDINEKASVLDMGSGTGILGIGFAALSSKCWVHEVVMSDWLLTPSLFGAVNWHRNADRLRNSKGKVRVQLFAEDCTNDIVLCNPPYVPLMPGHEDMAVHSSVTGTDLLHFLIRESAGWKGRTFVHLSSLSLKEAMQTADECGQELRQVRKRTIPFRPPRPMLERPGLIELLAQGKRLVRQKKGARYPYHHHVATYEVVKSKSAPSRGSQRR